MALRIGDGCGCVGADQSFNRSAARPFLYRVMQAPHQEKADTNRKGPDEQRDENRRHDREFYGGSAPLVASARL